jgi:putative colanic acid biosynthesis glycosyltransferase
VKVLQINTIVNSGSTGRITEEIGKILIKNGHDSCIAFGRGKSSSLSKLIHIGNFYDHTFHLLISRITDKHGFGSKVATRKLIKEIDVFKPDLIGLHNLHGYFLNIRVLFTYLKYYSIPIVWTLHDCWPFTGHCSYFDRYECFRWKEGCNKCPNINGYPASWFMDNSRSNFQNKKDIFTGMKNLTLVSPSGWLANYIKDSFLSNYNLQIINNGVDIELFRPIEVNIVRSKYKLNGKFILGVANIWDGRKGLNDFLELRKRIEPSIEIVLVGISVRQKRYMPNGITGILRTENLSELAELYSYAEVLVNPTYIDNFPTVNLEALACGTPVITYDTGGSPESIDSTTGFVVKRGDIDGLCKAINIILNKHKDFYAANCRKRAEIRFNKNIQYLKYLKLYEDLLSNPRF